MRLVKFILGTVFIFSSALVYADGYQSEIGLNYINIDSFDTDLDIGVLSGRYHFNEVNTDDVPFAEAAFLGRSNNVYGFYSHANQNLGSLNYLLGVDYNRRNFFVSPFLFSRELGNGDFFEETRSTLFGTEFGYFPIEGLRVSTVATTQGYDPNLRMKYVRPFAKDKAFNVEAQFTDFDGGNLFSVSGDYYFNKTTSLGLGFGERGNNSNTSFRARHFITPQINTSFELVNIDLANGDEKQVQFGISYRF